MNQPNTESTVVLIDEQTASAAFAYIASLPSPQSKYVMTNSLNLVARRFGAASAFEFDWAALRYTEVAAIRSWLLETRAPATVRRIEAGVRGCLRAAWHLGQIDTDSYQRTIDLPPLRGDSKAGRYATDEELEKLFTTCRIGPPKRGIRDLAILQLLFVLGLRVGEVIGLRFDDYEPSESSLSFFGKGRAARQVYVYGTVQVALQDWIDVRGPHSGYLFEVVSIGDTVVHRGIARTLTIDEMLAKRCTAAGIRHFAPHDGRRTAASKLLRMSDAVTTAGVLGHKTLNMVMLYARRGEKDRRAACKAVSSTSGKR